MTMPRWTPRTSWIAALLALAATACGDEGDRLTAPEVDGPVTVRGAAETLPPIQVSGYLFAFLPPLGSVPAPIFLSQESLLPELAVEACPWDGDACTAAPVILTSASSGGQRVRYETDAEGSHFLTNARVGPGPWRIRVLVGAVELGNLDVDATGRTIPVKFRLLRETLRLEGDPQAPAGPAIPKLRYETDPASFSDDHPEIPGMMISFNTLMVAFHPTATVAEVNAILDELEAEVVGGMPGTADAAGILVLRLPTTTHREMDAVLVWLGAQPQVIAASQDMLVEESNITQHVFQEWTWDHAPSGGNWGFELSRVPMMWNLNSRLMRLGRTTPVLIVDSGFLLGHEDLTNNILTGSTTYVQTHGTHVAGTVAAEFGNNLGVDGVNPFGRLILEGLNSWLSVIQTVQEAALDHPQARIMNLSLGFNWYRAPVEADESEYAQELAREKGLLFKEALEGIPHLGQLLIFAAAGNDSEAGSSDDARWASPFNYAALELGVENIVVVEALAPDAGSPGGATRADFSNVGGHVSAAGVGILSASAEAPLYAFLNGTSMATPFVAGLASYLLTLRPDLTTAQLKQLLISTAVPVGGGAAPRVDAYAAALASDLVGVPAADPALLMLVDVDDGTLDGNQRVDESGTPVFQGSFTFTGQVFGDYQNIGDGVVDMKDFRRFRDWLLQARDMAGNLDGTSNHPKKDLNGDFLIQGAFDEGRFARGDFNGNGVIEANSPAEVPGFPEPVTDLELLESLFQDPHPASTPLVDLLESFDLNVDPGPCLALPGIARARFTITRIGAGAPTEEGEHLAGEGRRIYTVPSHADGYTARMEVLNDTGDPVAHDDAPFALGPGGDAYWTPTCAPTATVSGFVTADGDALPDLMVQAKRSSDGTTTQDVTTGIGTFLFDALPVDGAAEDYEFSLLNLPSGVECPDHPRTVSLEAGAINVVDFECMRAELPEGPVGVKVVWPEFDSWASFNLFMQGDPFYGFGYTVVVTHIDTGERFIMNSNSAQGVNVLPPTHFFQFTNVPLGRLKVELGVRTCTESPETPFEVEHQIVNNTISTNLDFEVRCQ